MRRVTVFTGGRADLGILVPLVEALAARDDVEVAVLAGAEHGQSDGSAHLEGMPVPTSAALPDTALTTDAQDVARAMGSALVHSASAIADLRPDVVVVLGDRYEALAVAEAAVVMRCAVAHIHGGEVTGAVIDESFRHAITKLAHLHFVAAEPFASRVLRMGEDPATVFPFGSPGIDGIDAVPHASREACAKFLRVPPDRPFVLFTYHPLSLRGDAASEIAGVLDGLRRRTDAVHTVVTAPNRDPGGDAVAAALADFVAESPHRTFIPSLGRTRYIQAMRHAVAVVGNSSSGLIEAPAVGVPSIDIGDRQVGRLQGPSVLHVPPTPEAVSSAIDAAMTEEVRAVASAAVSPYGRPGAATRIAEAVATAPLRLEKRFNDDGAGPTNAVLDEASPTVSGATGPMPRG